MLTFLTPAALFGLSLLAIPIIIHLLKPRKMRRTPFSSLRWLQLTQQKLSRRLRLHQLLLFALRAGFITLLVLAIAKPIFDRSSAGVPTERFIVLDVSRSMSYRAGDEPTPLENGKRAAAKLLADGGPNDRTTLLTVADRTRVVGAPARGGERYVAKLGPLAAESTGTDLGSALETVRTLLGRRAGEARVELFLITDRAQGSVRPEEIQAFAGEFGERCKATIVDAASAKPTNGWIAEAVYLPAESDSVAAVELQLRAVGPVQERAVRLTGLADREDRSRTVTLDPQQPLSVTFELPADFDPKGKTCEIVLDPPDGLPSDDRAFLTFDAGPALDVVIVEARDRAGAGATPSFALRTALESLSSGARPINIVTKKFNEVQAADFVPAEVTFWADVPQLSDSALEALLNRVRSGMGFGLFLGPDVDVELYNRRLIDPLDRAKSLLPWPLERTVDVPRDEGGSAPLEELDPKHPLVARLVDPLVGDLADVRVTSYFRFKSDDESGGTVAANVLGTPFLIERKVGQGNVVVFNTTADDLWSDLPRRKSFVPLIDRALRQLAAGGAKRTFLTGEAIALTVTAPAAGETLKIITPGGSMLMPNITKTDSPTRFTLPPQSLPGLYRVRREGTAGQGGEAPESPFVVDIDRADSFLKPIDEEQLRSWWKPSTCTFVAAADVATGDLGDGPNLVAWMLAAAAILLALELLVVNRLCPRMNPRAAEAIVRRRPIVAKADRTEASTPAPTVAPGNA